METLASVWARDPCDLSDLAEKTAWDSPPVGLMWAEQLSPHLQRNKQLQDTLLQREEELARLQEENNKLRQFLNSSFVRNLEQKAKKLRADGRRTLKRNLMHPDDGPLQNHHQQVNKRVCRNLTAEFCSESSETSPSSEPNLDLWVLRTLGLKDRDTIDTSSDSSCSSSPGFSLSSSVYDAAVTSSSSSDCALNSSFGPVVTSTPSSVRSCSTHQPDYRFSPAESPQSCRRSPGSDFSAAGLTGPYDAPEAVIRSFNMLPALTEEPALTPSPHPAETRPISQGHQDKHPVYWTPPQDRIQISPAADRALHSPTSSLSPAMNRLWTPMSPSAGSQPQTPQTPRSRSDLAFSMSLSPSSSVKTHSFPQGQAFVRKDPEGRWNFTWVPRQGP